MGKVRSFRDCHVIDSEIKLPLMDRIRLILGSRMWFKMQIATEWKGAIDTRSSVLIEKAFRRRKTKASEPE